MNSGYFYEFWYIVRNKNISLQHVTVNDLYHQTLINIIEKLVPLTPDFAVLLESQLLNAKDKDSSGC